MPKTAKAPIIPASTAPTPPAGDGIRLAAIPTKKPWTSTAKGTSPPNASKLAHSTPMLAAQKPTAPPTASAPRQVARAPVAARVALQPALDVLRDQGDQQEDPDRHGRDRGRHDRPRERRVAGQ